VPEPEIDHMAADKDFFAEPSSHDGGSLANLKEGFKPRTRTRRGSLAMGQQADWIELHLAAASASAAARAAELARSDSSHQPSALIQRQAIGAVAVELAWKSREHKLMRLLQAF